MVHEYVLVSCLLRQYKHCSAVVSGVKLITVDIFRRGAVLIHWLLLVFACIVTVQHALLLGGAHV